MTMLQAFVLPKVLFSSFVNDGALKVIRQLTCLALLPTSKCFLEEKIINSQSNVIRSVMISLNAQTAEPQKTAPQDFRDLGLLQLCNSL